MTSIRRRTLTALPLLAAAALALTACSGTATATAGASAETAETLVVGTTGMYKPMNFTADGTLQGYDIDWANAIGDELGMEVEFVEGQLTGLLTGLQSDKYDVVMSSLTITDERKQSIDFSVPYVADGVIATALQSNEKVTDISDLDGLTVGITGGSGYMSAIQAIGGYTELKEYPGAAEAFADLKAGRIDVYAVGRIPANDFIRSEAKTSDPVVLAGDPLELLPAGVGVKKGDTELVEKIDAAITALKADGTYDELAEKWFGFTIED
jgi:ABC-type amino acid transport substrate-binding protein